MHAQSMTWSSEQLPDAVLRVVFSGRVGIGSRGNLKGARSREALRDTLAEHGSAASTGERRGSELHRAISWSRHYRYFSPLFGEKQTVTRCGESNGALAEGTTLRTLET